MAISKTKAFVLLVLSLLATVGVIDQMYQKPEQGNVTHVPYTGLPLVKNNNYVYNELLSGSKDLVYVSPTGGRGLFVSGEIPLRYFNEKDKKWKAIDTKITNLKVNTGVYKVQFPKKYASGPVVVKKGDQFFTYAISAIRYFNGTRNYKIPISYNVTPYVFNNTIVYPIPTKGLAFTYSYTETGLVKNIVITNKSLFPKPKIENARLAFEYDVTTNLEFSEGDGTYNSDVKLLKGLRDADFFIPQPFIQTNDAKYTTPVDYRIRGNKFTISVDYKFINQLATPLVIDPGINLTVRATTATRGGNQSYDWVEVVENGILSVDGVNMSLWLNSSNYILVATGGQIKGDGLGQAGATTHSSCIAGANGNGLGAGIGGGASPSCATADTCGGGGGGGSHGGAGSDAAPSSVSGECINGVGAVGTAGSTYGSATSPGFDAGSGGGGGGGGNANAVPFGGGGIGGAGIQLRAPNVTIIHNGTRSPVTSLGLGDTGNYAECASSPQDAAGGGGGSGGTIMINASTAYINHTNTALPSHVILDVTGGPAGAGQAAETSRGGRGGGGRIKIWAASYLNESAITSSAAGGVGNGAGCGIGPANGNAGTVATQSQGTWRYFNPPTLQKVELNSTFLTNFSNENLTAYVINYSDIDLVDAVSFVYNWMVNMTSIAILNVPMTSNNFSIQRTFDFSGYGGHGTLGNDVQGDGAEPLFTNTGCASPNGCYRFNSSQYINFSTQRQHNITDQLTIEAWVNVSTTANVLSKIVARCENGTSSEVF